MKSLQFAEQLFEKTFCCLDYFKFTFNAMKSYSMLIAYFVDATVSWKQELVLLIYVVCPTQYTITSEEESDSNSDKG